MRTFYFTSVSMFFALLLSVSSFDTLHADETDLPDESDERVQDKDEQKIVKSGKKPVAKNTVADLKALVDKGSYQKAYDMAQEMLFDHEGEPEFDLNYGSAALGIGEINEAIFVFERLVQQEPSNSRYQLELGRSYFLAGDRDRAKAIFESVLLSEQDLPVNVENQVLAYLYAIEGGSRFGDPEKSETLKGFIAISAGYDSNANAASDANVINAYINGYVFPTANATKAESTAFIIHQVGGAYVKPLGERSALDLRVMAQNRKNGSDLSALDQGTVFFEIANRWRFDSGIAAIGLRYSGVTLGHDDLYDFTQLSLSWSQPVDLEFADVIDVNLSMGTIRYSHDVNKVRDINPSSLSLGISKKVDTLVHSAGLQYGQDTAQRMDQFNYLDENDVMQTEIIKADHYSRNYYGLGYSLSYLYDEKTTYFGSVNYQTSSYKEEDHNFFNSAGQWSKRDGSNTSLMLGTTYNWNKSLRLNANVSTNKVTSKIDLYEFSRNKFEVGASYQL